MDKLMNLLISMRRNSILAKLSYVLMRLLGLCIPPSVKIGKNLKLVHWAYGLVIHPNTIIGDNVRIYSGVTIGRADIFIENRTDIKIVIEDNAIICTGAKILCKGEQLVVGKGSIIGANSVLFRSTGAGEIWGGIPALKIKDVIKSSI